MTKTILLFFGTMLFQIGLKAQTVVDTVSTGAGYVNDVWYSLQNDELGSATAENWDIAFAVSGSRSTSIYINSEYSVNLWTYPNGNVNDWATLDTTGLSTWTKLYNSDTSWNFGAFEQTINANDPFDVGWGIYNMGTHAVDGDSLFVIQLTDGSYRKLLIESLVGDTYSFKYAKLDGTDEQTTSISGSNFSDKMFAYYSIVNNVSLDREPAKLTEWDFVFKKQTAFLPMPYAVTSVLINDAIEVAQVNNVANVAAYNEWYPQTFQTEINTIGYDWKAYQGGYVIEDSLVYFVKSVQGDVWKVIFTGFGGSASGNYIFSKELISLAGINEFDKATIHSFTIYPNPSNGNTVTLVYDLAQSTSQGMVSIFNLSGKQVLAQSIFNTAGLNAQKISTTTLEAGLYVVSLTIDGHRVQQKLIVK